MKENKTSPWSILKILFVIIGVILCVPFIIMKISFLTVSALFFGLFIAGVTLADIDDSEKLS